MTNLSSSDGNKEKEGGKKKKISKRYSRRKKPLARRRLPVLAGSCCVAAAYYVCAYGMSISHNIRPGHTRIVGKTKSRATCVKHNFFFFLKKSCYKVCRSTKDYNKPEGHTTLRLLSVHFFRRRARCQLPEKEQNSNDNQLKQERKRSSHDFEVFLKSNSHFLLLFKRI